MKIAVCVSGAFNTKYKDDLLLQEYNQKIQNIFPTADFYYATWKKYKDRVEEILPDIECVYFSEPEIKYHPYLDIDSSDYVSPLYEETVNWVKSGGGKRKEWTSHHTKQILIHTKLVETISQTYDVYVRVRFDAYIADGVSFDKYLNKSQLDNMVFGFGTSKPKQFGKLVDITNTLSPIKQKYFIFDALIIYPSMALDIHEVHDLHKNHKLHAAEQGWCQVLCVLPNIQHRNLSGWVSNNKYGHPDGK